MEIARACSVIGPKNGVPSFDGDPVAELEAFIAETEARGEPVPAQARAMLERLRELVAALRDLTASFEQRAVERQPQDPEDDLH